MSARATTSIIADWADAQFIVRRRKAADRQRAARTGRHPHAEAAAARRASTARKSTAAGRAIRSSIASRRPASVRCSSPPTACRRACTSTPTRGIITGSAPARGTHTLTLRAKNRHGAASRTLKIVSGDTLALTPPMGWNHWYAHYDRVTDADDARGRRRDGSRRGMADVGLQLREYRRLLDEYHGQRQTTVDPLRIGPLPRRRRQHHAEQALSRYARRSPTTSTPRDSRPASTRSPGPLDLRRLSRAATSTRSRTRGSSPIGGLIS